ncbi:MAG TPA: polysaccharide pyruvyl transferase family protein [Gemmatimonadaceae bacterium]|nr:polysaccharide pyruvyl transferase family protein [Gemmatimonadaceae bacterium]
MLYPSGAGNLGDEAILQSTFRAIREMWPAAEITAFTLHPAKTATNHGVEAEPLTGVHTRLFGAPRPDGPIPLRAAAWFARRTRRVPVIGRTARFTSELIASTFFETISLWRAQRWLRNADLVVASGGGQLDAVWGGTWGQPYALARWAWLARRNGVPFALLSVGYGGAPRRLSRLLLRYAVSRAAYCSVRDAGSRELTMKLGVEAELPIVPDLAFALRPPPAERSRRPGLDVGVSPMTYLRPGSWPIENPDAYRRYVGLWIDLAKRVVARGDRVHLFVSDPGDMDAVRDVWAGLDDRSREHCSVAQVTSPDSLLALFRRLDVVISSRLHGVLLAIVATRPVLALSHERKVRAVMNDAGVGSFCLDLPTAVADDVAQRFVDLANQLDSCVRRLQDYATAARSAVRRQEDILPTLLRQR